MKKTEVAALIQEYNQTRNERLGLDQQSKKLKVKEDTLLDTLNAEGVRSGDYGPYRVTYSTKQVPRVTDWVLFHQYILQSGNIDMLTRHLTASAINARLEQGEYVPGVVTDDKPVYTITAN